MTLYSWVYPLTSLLVSTLVTLVLMPLLLYLCKKKKLYDLPDERKVHHSNNIPRLGGVLFVPAMLVGTIASLILMLGNLDMFEVKVSGLILLSGFFLIYLIGLMDDIFGMDARLKFVIQIVSSLFYPLCGVQINNLYGFLGVGELSLWLSYPLTIFVSLLIINAINLIDGIDGLASGLSIIALTGFTVLFYDMGILGYTLFSCGFLGAVIAFYYYNMFGSEKRNTKTFMGDAGSLVLGYALAYFAIKYAMCKPEIIPYNPMALFISYTLVLVPTFDLVRVALSRLKRGVPLFHPDKTHIHHKIMEAGLSMRNTLWVILSLSLFYIFLNGLLAVCQIDVNVIVLVDIILFSLLHLGLNYCIRRRKAKKVLPDK